MPKDNFSDILGNAMGAIAGRALAPMFWHLLQYGFSKQVDVYYMLLNDLFYIAD